MVRGLCYFFCKCRKKIKITDTKLYVPVVPLSTQDNAKLLEQLKSGFKRTTGINIKQKYQQKNKINI